MEIITTVKKESSWAEIKQAAENHELRSGDKIPVTLKNGENIVLVIGHDKRGKAFFAFEDCLECEHRMNSKPTDKGGWKATELRRWLNTKLLALLPDEIQDIIVPTKITQVIDGKRVESEDKLFLFSRTHMFGKGEYSEFEPEDSQIDIFRTEKSRTKECGSHGTWWYWLCSPYGGSGTGFCGVNGSGGANSNYASNTYGVAPGFCITKS